VGDDARRRGGGGGAWGRWVGELWLERIEKLFVTRAPGADEVQAAVGVECVYGVVVVRGHRARAGRRGCACRRRTRAGEASTGGTGIWY